MGPVFVQFQLKFVASIHILLKMGTKNHEKMANYFVF